MAKLYEAYDKKSDTHGLGWADQWDYKFNDTFGNEEADSQKGSGNHQKLAKMKATASAKTKSALTFGAQKMKSGTTSGIKWIKEKIQKKPQ